MENMNNNLYDILKDDFVNISPQSRLCLHLKFKSDISKEEVARIVDECESNKVGLIIPTIAEEDFDYLYPMRLLRIYGMLLESAEPAGIKIALNLERAIESAVVRYFDDEEESLRSRVLLKREYYCSSEEKVKIPIGSKVMSVVAVEENGDLIDLRSFEENGELSWQAPKGNWKICRYFCAEDLEQDRINMLNYDACMSYLDSVLDLFRTSLERHIGKTLGAIFFSDICFSARNRRNWDEGYNELFKKLNGFDPAPFYPCLYGCDEDSQLRYKALLMDCRAKLLSGGIMKALADTAKKEGMLLLGTLAEPKMSASSWTLGDAILVQADAPCAKLEKSYLYGFNSIEIAAGASEIKRNAIVACDAFEGYDRLTDDIIYRETATAFARGANFLMAHLDATMKDMKSYAEYVGRLQSILCRGENISDIAVLYPIYSLHSNVSLYDTPISEGVFEYPETPDITDYMSVINSISFYSGQDLTVLHPEMLEENSMLDKFSVVVIPATPIISIKSLRAIAGFFDAGGKVICTGVLPKKAAEIEENGGDALDSEVRALISHIFGESVYDEKIDYDYSHNLGDGGGESYFLHSTITGVDRCNIVPSTRIAEALASFDIPYDIYIDHMPRMESTGALNTNYPEYCLLGLSSSIRGGGMLNYIHKRTGECDIYFFSNATDTEYDGAVFLLGEHNMEIWNPVSASIVPMDYVFEKRNGRIYTKIALKLKSGESVLLVAK